MKELTRLLGARTIWILFGLPFLIFSQPALASTSPVAPKSSAPASETILLWHDQDPRLSDWMQKVWARTEKPRKTRHHSRHHQSHHHPERDHEDSPAELQIFDNVDLQAALKHPDHPENAPTPRQPDLLLLPNHMIGLHQDFALSEVPWAVLHGIKGRFAETAFVDGHYYGVPLFVSQVLLLFYNKKMVSKPIADFDHLQAMRSLDAEFTPIAWPYSLPAFFAPFLTANDAWPSREGTINLDTPGFREAFASYQALARSEVIDPACDSRCSFEGFLRGRSPYAIESVSSIGAARRALGKDLGVAPLPALHHTQLRSLFGTYTLAFPFNALHGKSRDRLLRFARELVSRPSQQLLLREDEQLPVNSAAFDASGRRDPELKVAIRETRAASAIPNRGEMTPFWSALGKVLTMISEPRNRFSVSEPGKSAQQLFREYASRLVKHDLAGTAGGANAGPPAPGTAATTGQALPASTPSVLPALPAVKETH